MARGKKFGLPTSRAFPVGTPSAAVASKGRAAQMGRAGLLSGRQVRKIRGRAGRTLRRG
jgi:hypothetical protein